MEINYNTLIEKIELTRKNNYNCTILLFFAGEVIMEEEEVELIKIIWVALTILTLTLFGMS